MTKKVRIRFPWMIVSLLLSGSACNMPTPTAVVAVEPSVVPPPGDTATAPFEGSIPVGLPAKRADHAGDVDSSANAARQLVSGGDVFVDGLYERPFNAGTMDKYFPYVDIIDMQGFMDGTWGYATITLADTDPQGGLSGQYGIEVDLDKDGRGDWLIRASNPISTAWTTQGVQAWQNTDGDIGGVAIMAADTTPRGGNGYEALVFDEGKSSLTDGAWVRINSEDPKTVEIAVKLAMLGSPASYAMGSWAGILIDPGMFDYHDHMTHAQAGSPLPGYDVYPLKDMAEIDNSCRLAIGFAPTGKEPGLCQTVEQREQDVPGAPPPPPIEPPK